MTPLQLESPTAIAPPGGLADLAASLNCEIHPFIEQNGTRTQVEWSPAEPARKRTFLSHDALWSCDGRVSSLDDDTFEIQIRFRLLEGQDVTAVIGLSFDFDPGTETRHVFMPAAVYQGNDFQVMPMPYPPLWRDAAEFREDMPVTITDLPRLTGNQARIEANTGDLSTPCMGFYDPSNKSGLLLFTEQETRLGNSGMTAELLGDDAGSRFSVIAPCVRERRQGLCESAPSADRPASWQAGDELTLRVWVSFFRAKDIRGMFDRFCGLRKALHVPTTTCCLPFSAALAIIEGKYNRENWDPHYGYYKMAPDAHTTFETAENPLCFLWQLGWVGGGMATLPLMAGGSPESRSRAWRNLEMIFEHTQAESGFFYGIGDGLNFFGDGFDRPWPHDMHMVRKSADWLYFSIKHFDLMEKQGETVPEPWDRAIRRLADAFVKLWRTHGQFGQIVDVKSGGLLVGGSCAGAIAPAGLVMAADRFREPCYLEVARLAGRKFHQEFVCKGITNGGPGEILSAPDSESAFALLESFAALMEHDDDPYWAEASHDTLRLAATWVVSYDYRFPPYSDLARSGAKTTGAVWANVQNKHAAPGICTLSGEAMLRYWRRSGDALALDLLHDIAHGIPQYLSREDRPLNERMRPGWMCERVNLSDWEGADGVGGRLFGSCWPEVSMMLTAIEIPGIYVQSDTGFVHVFDHVVCESVEKTGSGVMVRISNPTSFDAEVKVLCESSAGRALSLGLNPLHATPRVFIPAGATVDVEFKP